MEMASFSQDRVDGKALVSYNKYQYKPLESKLNSIRLLRLHPSPKSLWQVRVSLFETTLEEAPPYVALSYSWGDRNNLKPIVVDSDRISTLSVTQNLRSALQKLRPLEGESLVMWVDAICINQEDVLERNIQTANMRAIYQHAASVAVWLGLNHHGSPYAFQLIRTLSAARTLEDVERIILAPRSLEYLYNIVRLFRRQYWWRIWVIQEVSCAKNALVYCGDDSIPWSELDRVCDIFKGVEHHLSSLFYQTPSYVRTLICGGPRSLQLSRYSPMVSVPPLLELLTTHKSKKSTDPKDKVYALVGISGSQETFGPINYSLSEREIYSYTARHIITTTQRLDVICVKQHNKKNFELPSWVTDWTRPPQNAGATLVGLHHHEPAFRAAGSSLAAAQFSEDGYVLNATGFVISKITAVGAAYRKHSPPADVVHTLEVFHNWWDLFSSFEETNLIEAQAAFGRIISCGNWKFESNQIYAEKLESIFALSDEKLAESDVLRLNPISRSSTTTAISSSVGSLQDEEVDEFVGGEDGKAKMSTILSAGLMMNRRRFFVSEGNLMGLAMWYAEEGDIVCILLGCRFPVVLRLEEDHYVLVGEAYVAGWMEGQGMVALQEGGFSLRNFEIH